MKKIIASLLSISTLLLISGCLPVAFVAGATAGGVVISDQRSMGTIVKDKQITCKALFQLKSEPVLKNSHISVATFNRVVLLVGETPSPELKRRAYDLVNVIPQIRRINNEIVVGPLLERSLQSQDIWITTKVKTAMLAEKGLHSTQIKVITEGCVVYLMGLVSHEQADLAITVARQVTGVSKVVTLFEFAS